MKSSAGESRSTNPAETKNMDESKSSNTSESTSSPQVGHNPVIANIMHKAIADQAFPGGAIACGKLNAQGDHELRYQQGFGTYTFESSTPVSVESVFDIASLTKVLATSTSILILHDKNIIHIDDLVCKYLPAFAVNGKENISIKQLLCHTGGLKEWYNLHKLDLKCKDTIVHFLMNVEVVYRPGSEWRYSDLSMMILGLVVEKASGTPLDVFVEDKIFKPIGMTSTGYRRVSSGDFSCDSRIVPTEVDKLVRERLLWGEVHDLNTFLMGGVAGHAGLFSTVTDISKFCVMILSNGIAQETGKQIFSAKAASLYLSHISTISPYGFGWNFYGRPRANVHSDSSSPIKVHYKSGGTRLSPKAVGHTGFTGTSVWIDPEQKFYIVLLTNAVHPHSDSENGDKIREIRPAVADAAFGMAFPQIVKKIDSPSPGLQSVGKKLASLAASAFDDNGNARQKWKHIREIGVLTCIILFTYLR